MNQIVPVDEKPKRQLIEVVDPIPVLDTSRFEHMQRIASVMAQSTLIPESLYMEGPKDNKVVLPLPQIISNCFLVVNQAVRWGLDPFAVAQSVAVVHGKLCYEGKLVSAVLDAKMGVRLHHHFVGSPGNDEYRIYLSDQPFDIEIEVEIDGQKQRGQIAKFLKPGFRHPAARLFDGSVGEWKTAGAGTPWTPKNHPRMLIYRGTRDWARIYESAIMLGVYTPDELLDLAENVRAGRAREVPTVMQRLAAARTATQEPQERAEGFDPLHVARETANASGGAAIEQEQASSPAAAAADDVGSGKEAVTDPESTAADQAGDEPAQAGADSIEARAEPVAPSVPANDLYTRAKCIEALLKTATDKHLSVADRIEVMGGVGEDWSLHLNDREFVRTAFDTARKVAKGELTQAKAKQFLDGLPAKGAA